MRRLLGEEHGMALVLSVGVLLVLTITLSSALELTSAGARHEGRNNGDQKAYALAKAGINNAVAMISKCGAGCSIDSSMNQTLDGGNVTWGAEFVPNKIWQTTATGSVAKPTGSVGEDVTLTIMARVH